MLALLRLGENDNFGIGSAPAEVNKFGTETEIGTERETISHHD